MLLALFERIPNEDAIARAPTAGWMMLFLAVCLAVILLVHREGFRRLWMRAEDPRTMGVFRIAFAICAMCNINGLWELFE
jgi:ABC-type sulfate transport system permease component